MVIALHLWLKDKRTLKNKVKYFSNAVPMLKNSIDNMLMTLKSANKRVTFFKNILSIDNQTGRVMITQFYFGSH